MNANGRVNLIQPDISKQFSLYDKIPVGKSSDYECPLAGLQKKTMLSTAYFSKENIQIVHDTIRKEVYSRSRERHIIGPQNIDTLKIIMRSIYLQNSVNKPCQITEQIKALNLAVVNYAVPQILGEIEAYIKYKNDVSTLPIPLTRPAYLSTAGSNVLELKPFF